MPRFNNDNYSFKMQKEKLKEAKGKEESNSYMVDKSERSYAENSILKTSFLKESVTDPDLEVTKSRLCISQNPNMDTTQNNSFFKEGGFNLRD